MKKNILLAFAICLFIVSIITGIGFDNNNVNMSLSDLMASANAQGNEGSKPTPKSPKKEWIRFESDVECEKTTYTTTSSGENNNNSWGGSASVSGNWGPVGANASGNYSQSNSGNQVSSTTHIETQRIKGKKIDCASGSVLVTCTPFNPCD